MSHDEEQVEGYVFLHTGSSLSTNIAYSRLDKPTEGVAPKFAPKCIWCNAPWSDENVHVYDIDAADECESGRFGPPTATVSISCHSCEREMYRKEGVHGW